MKKYILKNLDCANCAAKLERELKKSEYVKDVSIDFGTLTMLIDSSNSENDLKIIKNIEPKVEVVEVGSKVKKEGQDHSHSHDHGHEHGDGENLKVQKIKIVVSLVFLFLGFMSKSMFNNIILTNMIFLVSYIVVGYEVIVRAIRNILKGNFFDEFFLMSFATIAAFFINQFSEAAGVMVFYSIGELFQEISVNNSRKSIKSLLELKPESANLFHGKYLLGSFLRDGAISLCPIKLAVEIP